jgi:serine/threonine-protein kinase RsbW
MRFVDERSALAALQNQDALALRVAVEEVCENIVKYAYAGRDVGPIVIEFASSPEQVTVSIEDEGAAFDPAALPPADVTSEWRSRPLGGLGWHLVRQLMDDIRYEPISIGGNRVTLVKRRTAAL